MTRRVRLLVTMSDLVGRGAERELVNLLSRLPRDQFEIHLCLWRAVFDYPCPADIPVTIVEKTKPWHVFRTIDRMRNLIDTLSPDVVFSQLNYVSTVTGSAVARARKHRPRWVARLAGNPEQEIRWPVLPWTRRSLARADRVAGCSPAVARSIERHLRIPKEQTTVLENVVDLASILRASREPSPIAKNPATTVIASAGRFVGQKNHSLLLNAVSRIPRKEVEVWLLGAGPLERNLRREAADLGLGSRVRFLGFQPNPHAIVRQADLFVLPSRYEGLPNALLEAMAIGTPVISTDCKYGPADLITPGQTGSLVPPGDVAGLANAIAQALERPEETRRQADAAQSEILKRFDPNLVIEQYARCFTALAERGTP